MVTPAIMINVSARASTDVQSKDPDEPRELTAPRISLVIPALNEARNLPYVFASLPRAMYEVILVAGHSTDDTVAVARSLYPDVRIVRQARRG